MKKIIFTEDKAKNEVKWYDPIPYGGAEQYKLKMRLVITESSREMLEESDTRHFLLFFFLATKVFVQNSGKRKERECKTKTQAKKQGICFRALETLSLRLHTFVRKFGRFTLFWLGGQVWTAWMRNTTQFFSFHAAFFNLQIYFFYPLFVNIYCDWFMRESFIQLKYLLYQLF